MTTLVSKIKSFSIVASFALVAGVLGGCASNNSASRLSAVQNNPAKPVAIVKSGQGSFSHLPHIMVQRVSSAKELYELGLTPGKKGFNIDFSKNDAVIIALGKRSEDGYWTKITALQREGNKLYVQGIANKPEGKQGKSSSDTYPFALAVVPKEKDTQLVGDIKSVEGQSEK